MPSDLIGEMNRFKAQHQDSSNPSPSIQSKTWTDDMYNQYLDSQSWLTPQQREYMMSNPWLASRQAPYAESFWDFVDPGRREKEYYNAMRSNAMDWASKALENFRQQNYDSAPEQVLREQTAGLNPDLNGQVNAGSAAENDEAGQPPLPTSDSPQSFTQIGGAALKFFQFVLSGARSLQDMRINADNAVMNELGTNTAARDFLMHNLATQAKFNAFDIPDLDADDANEKLAAAIAEAKFPGYSRRTSKYLQRMAKTYSANSLAVEDVKWQLRANIQENKKRVQSIRSEKGFDDNFQTWVNNGARLFSDVEYSMWQIENRAKREGWSASYLDSKLQGVKTKALNDAYGWVNSGGKWYNTLGVLAMPILGSALGSVASGVGTMLNKGIPAVTKKFNYFKKL